MEELDPFRELFVGISAHEERSGELKMETINRVERRAFMRAFPQVPIHLKIRAAQASADAILLALNLDDPDFTWDSIDQVASEIAEEFSSGFSGGLDQSEETEIAPEWVKPDGSEETGPLFWVTPDPPKDQWGTAQA